MPRLLSRDEFEATQARVIAAAPDGLSREDFDRYMSTRLPGAIAEAENETPASAALKRVQSGDVHLGEILAPLAQAMNPIAAIKSVATAARHPIDTLSAIGQGVTAEGHKATDAFREGRYSEAVGHGVAGMIPVLGPAAAHAGERIAEGDIEGGLGEGAAMAFAAPASRAMMAGGNRVLKSVSNLSRRAADKAAKGALKIDRGYLEKMAGGRPIVDKENEIIRTLYDDSKASTVGSGWTGKSILDDAQTRLDAADAARTERITSAPRVPIAGSDTRPLAAVRAYRRTIKGDAPQERLGQVNRLMEDMQTSPGMTKTIVGPERIVDRTVSKVSPILDDTGRAVTSTEVVRDIFPGEAKTSLRELTPVEMADAIRGNNETMRGLFGPQAGLQRDAELQARLAANRARTAMLDEAAGTKDLSDKMRRMIDLRNVANISARRIDATNPISLPDVISLSAARPEVFLASQAMKGNNLLRLGRAADTASKRLKKADLRRYAPNEAAILLEQLQQQALQDQLRKAQEPNP